MNTQDILSIFLILGIITVSACMIVLTYFFIQALKAIQGMADRISSTTEGLKNGLGLKMLTAIPSIFIALLSKFIKRGR